MNRFDSAIITNGKETIKCSNCGSEKRFVLVEGDGLPLPANGINISPSRRDTQENHRRENLAHLFEAQKRFGE